MPPAAGRRHRHAGATLRLRKPSLAYGSSGTPQRVSGRRRRGQRPGTGGRTPTAQPRSARAGAPPERPVTLSPFKPTPAYPAWPLPIQSIVCTASPRYPLPPSPPHPGLPLPCTFSLSFLPLKRQPSKEYPHGHFGKQFGGSFRARLKSTRRPHNASARNP